MLVRVKNYVGSFSASITAAIAILIFPFGAFAEAIAVIYPDVEETYLSIYLQILDGIKEKAKGDIVPHQIKGEVDAPGLNGWLRSRSIKRTILLGRQSIKVANLIDPSIRVVMGGAILSPTPDTPLLSGISLTPDPERLFMTLRQLAPSIKRVI